MGTVTDIRTNVSNMAINLESTNTISICLNKLILEEESELTLLRSYGINLKPRGGFTPSHLSQLLDEQAVPCSRLIGETVYGQINESFANDDSLREPVYVTVDVDFTEDRRPNANVIQRLVKEQRVEPMDLKETNEIDQCSICIEELSTSRENIIRMPQCKHMFHQDCLFEWLGRQMSCPLCRSVPYGESRNNQRFG